MGKAAVLPLLLAVRVRHMVCQPGQAMVSHRHGKAGGAPCQPVPGLSQNLSRRFVEP